MLWCTHVKLTLQLQLLFNIVWPAKPKTLETLWPAFAFAFATLAAICGNSIRWLDSVFVCNYYALIAGGTTWLRCLPVQPEKKWGKNRCTAPTGQPSCPIAQHAKCWDPNCNRFSYFFGVFPCPIHKTQIVLDCPKRRIICRMLPRFVSLLII